MGTSSLPPILRYVTTNDCGSYKSNFDRLFMVGLCFMHRHAFMLFYSAQNIFAYAF